MDVYLKKLSEKDPMLMDFQELEDWLDHIIYAKMKYDALSVIQKDTFNHILHYFRLNQFVLQLIMAKAETNQYYIRALMSVMHETNPAMADAIVKKVETLNKEHTMELIKDETPEHAQRIIDRAKELQKKIDKQKQRDN